MAFSKYLLWSFLCLILGLSPVYADDTARIYFESTPPGAVVTVEPTLSRTPLNNQLFGQCVTPCSITLVKSIDYKNLRMTKAGYKERFEKAYLIVGPFKEKKTKVKVLTEISDKDIISYDTIHWTLEKLDEADLALDKKNNENNVVKAKPIFRQSPKAPKWLNKKENCAVKFNVDKTGQPLDIIAECTDERLKKRAVKAVKKWRYEPKLENDVAVKSGVLKARLKFSPPARF